MKFLYQLICLFFFTPVFCHGEKVIRKMDVPYGTVGGQKLLLDVYQPATQSTKPRPAIVLVHGGAWSAGDKADFGDLTEQFAQMGYVAFSINYRLVTETGNRWPAQLDDCQRAIRWVRAHAAEYNIDPHRVGAIGGSAGGHLVACLGTMDTRDNSDKALAAFSSRPDCIVDLAGPTDFTVNLAPQVADGAWTLEQIRILLGADPLKNTALAKSASPLYSVDKKTVPFLIFQGKSDPVVPPQQAQLLQSALEKNGTESRLILFDGGHGLENVSALATFILETKKFFERHLKH